MLTSKFREVKSPQFPISFPTWALGSEASALLAQDDNITLLHPLFFVTPSCTVPSVLFNLLCGDFDSQEVV